MASRESHLVSSLRSPTKPNMQWPWNRLSQHHQGRTDNHIGFFVTHKSLLRNTYICWDNPTVHNAGVSFVLTLLIIITIIVIQTVFIQSKIVGKVCIWWCGPSDSASAPTDAVKTLRNVLPAKRFHWEMIHRGRWHFWSNVLKANHKQGHIRSDFWNKDIFYHFNLEKDT